MALGIGAYRRFGFWREGYGCTRQQRQVKVVVLTEREISGTASFYALIFISILYSMAQYGIPHDLVLVITATIMKHLHQEFSVTISELHIITGNPTNPNVGLTRHCELWI